MKYHGPMNGEARKNYISDFSIDEQAQQLTITTEDKREFHYPLNQENLEILEQAYREQSEAAIENIPKYKTNRAKAKVLSMTSGVGGALLTVIATTELGADPIITVAGVGAVVVGTTIATAILSRSNEQKLKEAIHFQALKSYGAGIVSYIHQSDNAFAGFSDDRKAELLHMIKTGIDPTSLLEVDGAGLTTAEIGKFNDNIKTEKTYCFVKEAK